MKEANVQRYHHETHRHLEDRLVAFLNGYNFIGRLKNLRSVTPDGVVCLAFVNEQGHFRLDLLHLTSGPNNSGARAFGPASAKAQAKANGTSANPITVISPDTQSTSTRSSERRHSVGRRL